MTTYGTTVTAVLALFACFALDTVWTPRSSVAASNGRQRAMAFSLRTADNGGGTRGRKTYAEESLDYDSGDGVGGGDYKDDDDDYVDGGDDDHGHQQQDHEDQLDQDDPGKLKRP